jgi:hypothetical protein
VADLKASDAWLELAVSACQKFAGRVEDDDPDEAFTIAWELPLTLPRPPDSM